MLEAILIAWWFFLPAGLANAIPVLAAKLPGLKSWDYPIDGFSHFRGHRVLGDHKTVRGLLSGIVVAILALFLQAWAVGQSEFLGDISVIDYENTNLWLLGLAFAVGALGGDALKSFFKRQFNIKPGKGWFPFDQLDYIIGGIALSLLVVQVEFGIYAWVLLVWFIIHPLATWLAYLAGLKKSPI